MSQDKYLAASRGFRSSALLLAATVSAVLQSLPQALGIDQYRNLRKAIDGLQSADAEMTALEDDLTAKLAEIETDVKPAVEASPAPEEELAKKPAGRAIKTDSAPAGVAAEIKAEDAKSDGAGANQASLNV
ncbi:MAG: hypothetical protein NVV72_01105 [Asticcacaulis sp.]|nr:hypothetical protein [Asticcacaulis sp.]